MRLSRLKVETLFLHVGLNTFPERVERYGVRNLDAAKMFASELRSR